MAQEIDLLAGSKKQAALSAMLLQEALSGKPAHSGGEAAARALAAGLAGLFEKQDEERGLAGQLALISAAGGGAPSGVPASPMPMPSTPPPSASMPPATPVSTSGGGFVTPPADKVMAFDDFNHQDAMVAKPQELAAALNLKPQEMDVATKTVIGEAGGYKPIDQQAVASVLFNRAGMAGTSPATEALRPNQFEPWNTAQGRNRMASAGPEQYEQAARAVYMGAQADPTAGATHFYAPKAQASLGRQPPKWDDGSGQDLGPHRFFNKPYGGQQAPQQAPPQQLAQAAPQQPGLSDDMLKSWAQDASKPIETRRAAAAMLMQRIQAEQQLRQEVRKAGEVEKVKLPYQQQLKQTPDFKDSIPFNPDLAQRSINYDADKARAVEGAKQPFELEKKAAPNFDDVQKIQDKDKAKGSMGGTLKQLTGAYLNLDQMGAITNPNRGALSNIQAYAGSSPVGQMIGQAVGSDAASIRQQITNMRPAIISDIMKATGLSAQSINSNQELQFYLQQATDPSKDIFSNLAAIEALDKRYGLGGGLKEMLPPDWHAAVQKRSGDLDKLRQTPGASPTQGGWSIREIKR